MQSLKPTATMDAASRFALCQTKTTIPNLHPTELIARCRAVFAPPLCSEAALSQPSDRFEICPERGGERFKVSTQKRPSKKDGRSDAKRAKVTTLNLVKKHCSKCLNDTLIDIKATGRAVRTLFTGICSQCGVKWTDIKQSPQEHSDHHIKSELRGISDRTKGDTFAAASKYETGLQHRAFQLYFEEAKINDWKQVKGFAYLSPPLQNKYLYAARVEHQQDDSLLEGTPHRDLIDNRPTLSDAPDVECFLNRDLVFRLSDIIDTYGTLRHILSEIIAKSTRHEVYTVAPIVQVDNWGKQDYVCAVCYEEFDLCFHSDLPTLQDARLCSCLTKDSYPPVDIPAIIEAPQVAIRDVDIDRYFLYESNSMFSSFVVHTKCCLYSHHPQHAVSNNIVGGPPGCRQKHFGGGP